MTDKLVPINNTKAIAEFRGNPPAPTAQPAQQPGATEKAYHCLTAILTHPTLDLSDFMRSKVCDAIAAIEAAPAQRQPLTQDEILDMAEGVSLQFHDLLEFARAIEAAHGITAATAAQKGEKL